MTAMLPLASMVLQLFAMVPHASAMVHAAIIPHAAMVPHAVIIPHAVMVLQVRPTIMAVPLFKSIAEQL